MVDLQRQYLGIAEEVDTAFREILESAAFINGPKVKAFTKDLAEYNDARHVIPCANGTDALQIALMALDLKPGDEIIAPGFTFIASVEVIALMGRTPVIAEVDPGTFNMDPDHVRTLISARTKVIMPVHLFGQCCDMDAIMEIAKEHNLYVIEDNAQSIGAVYTFKDGITRKAGTMGHIGTTSFYPSKNLGAYGDAGAVMTNDDTLGEALQSIANHGMSIRYHHDRVGVNSRLDSFQAAVLHAKLKRLDQYNKARQDAAEYYDRALKDIPEITVPKRNPSSTHVFHQYTIKVDAEKRDTLKAYLQDKGVPSMIYYPIPTQNQKAFEGLLKNGDSAFPVTDRLCETVLSLPMHSNLEPDELAYICNTIREYFED